MALTASQRNTIYEKFAPLLGEEVANALLSQFPANDLETPATKDFVRAECIALKTDVMHEIDLVRTDLTAKIDGLRTELKTEMADLRTELKSDIYDLRTELKGDIYDLRTELKGEIGELRVQMGDLRTEMQREFRLQLVATLTFVGALLTAFRLL